DRRSSDHESLTYIPTRRSSDLTIDFEDGADIYWARQQVSERLDPVTGMLPADASGGLAPITTPLGDMIMFTIEGPLSLTDKRTRSEEHTSELQLREKLVCRLLL